MSAVGRSWTPHRHLLQTDDHHSDPLCGLQTDDWHSDPLGVLQTDSQHTNPQSVLQADSQHSDPLCVLQADSQHTDPLCVLQADSQHSDPLCVLQADSQHTDPLCVLQADIQHTDPLFVLPRAALLSLLLLLLLCRASGHIRPIPGLPLVNFSAPGDVVFGVVMSLHSYSPHALCSDVIRELGALQRLESIVFAVEEINARQELLPGVTLGYVIMDDCYNELVALGRALHFIQTAGSAVGQTGLPAVEVVAVVGAEGSPRTLQLADVLSVYHVPVISYASSSALLDDKTKYAFFSRIVPSDRMQAKAIVGLVRAFGWRYVSVLYSDGSYGTEGFRAIQEELETHNGFCTAVTHIIRSTFSDRDYEEAVRMLQRKSQAHVVILFTTQEQALRLFSTLQRTKQGANFTWVGGDSIAMNPHTFAGLESIVAGMLSVNFIAAPVPRFENHFKHLTLNNGSRNPWFQEFYSTAMNCCLAGQPNPRGLEMCREEEGVGASPLYEAESTVSLAINAVHALARGLSKIQENCNGSAGAAFKDCVTPESLLTAIRSARFVGEGVNISFDPETGSGLTVYEVRNMALNNGVLRLRTVGLWDPRLDDFVFFHKDMIQWKADTLAISVAEGGNTLYPESVCHRPCKPGFQAKVTQPSCCFVCDQCRDSERTVLDTTVINAGLPRCDQCPYQDNLTANYTWPDEESRTQCLPIPYSYLGLATAGGILVAVCDAVVFLITCAVVFFFNKNRKSRLIKACSLELSQIILIDHLLTCLLVIAFVLSPTTSTCIITHGGFHLSFTLSYGPLLVRTNRIYRIFGAGKRSAQKPPFISTRAQLFMTATIVTVQLGITAILTGFMPPVARVDMPNLNEKVVTQECQVPQASFLTSICYNLLVMAFCAAQAFKTRRLPTNFNEAKFITFCIYTTILLWLSFIPTYFTAHSYEVQALSLAVALLFNVVSCQVFLFLPKLYALYFLSEEDMNLKRDQALPSSSGSQVRGSSISLNSGPRTAWSLHVPSSTDSQRETGRDATLPTVKVRTVSSQADDPNSLQPSCERRFRGFNGQT